MRRLNMRTPRLSRGRARLSSACSDNGRYSHMSRKISYVQAINEALHEAMAADPNVICYGLGVDDPKAVFGSTTGLRERFGNSRVFDMPTSENAMTGVANGATLNGIRPEMVLHQIDYATLH